MKQILLLSTILIFAVSCVSNPEASSLALNEEEDKEGRICKQEQVLGSKNSSDSLLYKSRDR